MAQEENNQGNGESTESSQASFTVPETDGIQSGVPGGNTGPGVSGAADFTAEGFNQRIQSGQANVGGNKESAASSGVSQIQQISGGLTIRAKLTSSLALLTVVIIALGVVSFTSLLDVNDVSVGIADRYAKLAKISEEIKSTVYLIRDAEKDFLLLEEQEALDRSTRFVARLRTQIEKATEIGAQIQEATGVAVGNQYLELADQSDAYEQQFAQQVKSVKSARTDINQDVSNTAELKDKLEVEVENNRVLVKSIVDDFWISNKSLNRDAMDLVQKNSDQIKSIAETTANEARIKLDEEAVTASQLQAREQKRIIEEAGGGKAAEQVALEMAILANNARTKVAAAGVKAMALVLESSTNAANNATEANRKEAERSYTALNLGILLTDLDRMLLNVQIRVANYLQLNKQSEADGAKVLVSDAMALTDQISRETDNEKIQKQMAEVRQNLAVYLTILNETITNVNDVFSKKILTNKTIDDQKADMKVSGEKLIEVATDLSNGAWAQVASESLVLRQTGSNAQTILLVMVVIGAAMGLTVLWVVPRPILAAINQLLNGAQRVAAGDLTIPVEVATRDELGQLAATFDHMRANLLGLVDRIKRASVQITTTVNEIQASTNQQSATATEQSSALNEFAVSLKEIVHSAESLAGTSTEVAQNSRVVVEQVADSNSKSAKMMDSMNAIGDSTRQTSDRIKSLNDQMDNISEAVSTISGVADQTTLLSLNAAIEANKAGEMGKGFSVVATEIRRLSDRSTDATGEITGMVRDIQRATESSVVSMDKSSEEIRLGIDMVRESTDTMVTVNESMSTIGSQTDQIARGASQQAKASGDAQNVVGELLNSANLVAQASRQSSSAVYELNAMATQLGDAVAAFRT